MADDLFTWLDALWNKKKPEGTFPLFIAHRFLASDPDLATGARVLQREVREPDLVFHVWQGLLPKGRAAPRGMKYVAAKKPPDAEALIARMMAVLGERRTVVEQMVEVVRAAGREQDLYTYYGVEQDGREAASEDRDS